MCTCLQYALPRCVSLFDRFIYQGAQIMQYMETQFIFDSFYFLTVGKYALGSAVTSLEHRFRRKSRTFLQSRRADPEVHVSS
jgi:hypothetical protein